MTAEKSQNVQYVLPHYILRTRLPVTIFLVTASSCRVSSLVRQFLRLGLRRAAFAAFLQACDLNRVPTGPSHSSWRQEVADG